MSVRFSRFMSAAQRFVDSVGEFDKRRRIILVRDALTNDMFSEIERSVKLIAQFFALAHLLAEMLPGSGVTVSSDTPLLTLLAFAVANPRPFQEGISAVWRGGSFLPAKGVVGERFGGEDTRQRLPARHISSGEAVCLCLR